MAPNQIPVQHSSGAASQSEKRKEHEVDHLPTSNSEVKSGGVIPPLPHEFLWHGA
jgi:hypothetical protein